MSIRNALLPALPLALLGCGGVETVAVQDGGGVETTALVGMVEFTDGSPAAGTRILLRDQDFLASEPASSPASKRGAAGDSTRPDTATLQTVADEEGRYRIPGVRKGAYLLEFVGPSRQAATLRHQVSGQKVDSLSLTVLRAAGSLRGQVLGEGEKSGRKDGGKGGRILVQVYGLDRSTWADSATGRFRLDPLPAGAYSLRFSTSGGADTLRIDNAVIQPDSVTWLPSAMVGWSRSETFAVAAEDAVPASTLERFPLLLRLDSTWSGFAEARPDGADLRVLGPGGRLPLEIAAWDPGRSSAQLWVLLDSLPPAGSLDLRLLWGNPGAASVSDGRAVFDTALGFLAAAHLESGSGWREAATGQAPVGATGGEVAEGRIGDGLRFKGRDPNILSYPGTPALSASNTLAAPGGCTFSLWIHPAEDLDTATDRRTLMARGAAWDGAHDQDWALWILAGNVHLEARAAAGADSSAWAEAILPAGAWEKDRWYHLAVVYDGSAVRLYRDGLPLGPAVPFERDFLSSDDNPVWSLGRHHPDRPELQTFDGILDEVRIQRGVLTGDWLRASVLNQGPENRLVKRKPGMGPSGP